MSKQYAHLHTMAKTSVKFQNDWPKTVEGVALTAFMLKKIGYICQMFHLLVKLFNNFAKKKLFECF